MVRRRLYPDQYNTYAVCRAHCIKPERKMQEKIDKQAALECCLHVIVLFFFLHDLFQFVHKRIDILKFPVNGRKSHISHRFQVF